MVTHAVYNTQNKKVKDLELSDVCFDTRARKGLVFEAVQSYLQNQRQGTANTKTRGEVRGGGRKPYKQKGTGNARQGSIRAPNYVGGGVAFGPHPRDYEYTMPKKMRHAALASALTLKRKAGELLVLDDWAMKATKTKEAKKTLDTLGLNSALVVTSVKQGGKSSLVLSLRNVKNIKAIPANGLTVYDVLRYDRLVLTEKALEELTEVLS